MPSIPLTLIQTQTCIFTLDAELTIRSLLPPYSSYDCKQELPAGVLPKLSCRVLKAMPLTSTTFLVLFENLHYLMVKHLGNKVESFTVSELVGLTEILDLQAREQ